MNAKKATVDREGPAGKIADLIDAGYTCIYLLSFEEERVLRHVREMSSALFPEEVPLWTWSTTEGFQGPEPGPVKGQSVIEPMAALRAVEGFEGKGHFVLKDFHPFLSDPLVVRKLRDLHQEMAGTGRVLFLLSPRLVLPHDLSKDVFVFDYPLPAPEELDVAMHEELAGFSDRFGELLVVPSEDREQIVRTFQGLTEQEARQVVRLVVDRKKVLDAGVVDDLLEEKRQIIRKSEILDYIPKLVTMDEVGGLGRFKRWARVRAGGFTEAARKFGLPQPKGILVTGISGCGKSLAIQALASHWNMPLLRLDMGRVFAGLAGSPEESMRRALITVEAVAPAVLWIDEIEMGISVFSDSVESGATSRIFAMFLTWMQEKMRPVFIGATANDIDRLPPEFIRKGRFDEVFFVDLPNEADRKEIFKVHINKRGKDISEISLDGLAKATEGYSGAEIEQAIIAALYEAFAEGRDLTINDIYRCQERMVPLAVTMKEQIIKTKRWAENRAVRAS